VAAGPLRAYEQAAVECVIRSANGVSLHEMREAPDADLLRADGAHVGVEVVRTIDQRYLDAAKRLDATTDAIRRELEARKMCGHFFVYLDVVKVASARSAQLRALPKRVADFLEANAGTYYETEQLGPLGDDCVAAIERRDAPKTFVYPARRLTRDAPLAATVLAKKHEKLRDYRSKNGDYFQEYWLAIASLGPGTIEDGGFTALLSRGFTTEFDRVFLVMHDPGGRLVAANEVTPTTAQRPP
jgi:hypothetical protein